MSDKQTETTWKKYLETELPVLQNILFAKGYTLDDNQPHIKGERFLMQAVTTTSGLKVILYGQDSASKRVVIKASRDQAGKDELRHERMARHSLHEIDFAYDVFYSPEEIDFIEENGFLVTITEFIEQDCSFLERTLEEQFNYCLTALKAQEKARATTLRHIRKIKTIFNYRRSGDYLRLYAGFWEYLKNTSENESTVSLIEESQTKLNGNKNRIEQYCGFLTHTDFVPHNFRIKNNTLYLLDFSSLQFGNKHESWARLLNFMTLYNRDLENLLIEYVENNRSTEERESLQLMRIFRLGEIVTYYTKNSALSSGPLKELNQSRIDFWTEVLSAELKNRRVADDVVLKYQKKRDSLRSEEEKQRQIGLH